ncbi:MAG TPA: tryptophan-rich sensory protein [Anaerolineales bacterium]|nr:tryptophan-rich sensory protein [Anaerolineales bacterium]
MKRSSTFQAVTVLTTLITLTVNALANALPLNGQTTGEISDRFSAYFVPAGYVFSIWGLIYVGLIAYTIYQALPAQRDDPTLRRIAPAYWLASLANSIWIFLWHYEHFAWTLVAMVTLLLALIAIYRMAVRETGAGRWFVRLPFSIYLGWISVATIANFAQVLSGWGWGASNTVAVAWTVIMIAVAVLLGLLMRHRENDLAYGLVLIWALVGIAVEQADVLPVSYAAWGAVAVLAVGSVLIPLSRGKPAAPAG